MTIKVFSPRTLVLIILSLLSGCDSYYESKCEANPQCVYESCLQTKQLLKKQGNRVGDTMQCSQS